MRKIAFLVIAFAHAFLLKAQTSFDYTLSLVPVSVPGFPGLHSFVHAQHDGKWLLIGGRKDGMHARQPFSSFPQASNNTDIYVVDINTQQLWSASVNTLPAGLKEQLQSTNMNFDQNGTTLYIVGGYGFSVTANDHITYPNLTSVDIPGLMNAVISGTSITPFFKQITHDNFAVTGGHLNQLNGKFYLVGGHRFDGRYNPMNNPTFIQTYTNEIRMFNIDNSGTQLSFSNYSVINDPVHLRRRDYNLVPQIYPNGEPGLMISSGVFQINADLPFLYPVEITAAGHTPVTAFNQYLSNYHSANAALYDASANEMHSLFFGGISQYYYQNGTLIQDNQVPFVKTISRVTRNSLGQLQEFKLPQEMPNLKGASAEFLYNWTNPHYPNGVLKLNDITENSFVIGHIVGGIQSSSLNPFSSNQTALTSADASVYEVRLTKNPMATDEVIDGRNPFQISVSPNPFSTEFKVTFNLDKTTKINWLLTDASGKIIRNGLSSTKAAGKQSFDVQLEKSSEKFVVLTVIFDDKFYVTRKLLRK